MLHKGPQSNTLKVGFYSAILTSLITILTFSIAINSPPISGVFCISPCIEYPYREVADRFPKDYLWMYPAIVLTMTYLILVVAIHRFAGRPKKIFSLTGLAFAMIAASMLIMNYFVQVTVIQPSLVNGETEGIALLTQYNPHGLFIAWEEVGFLMMSVSFAFLAPVFSGKGIRRAIRWILITCFLLSVFSLFYSIAAFGIERGYKFEIAVISIDWLGLIVLGILLAILFKREMNIN